MEPVSDSQEIEGTYKDNLNSDWLCMLLLLLSPLSACGAASHGLSLLFPLSLFTIFHPFCLSVVTFPLVLVLPFCLFSLICPLSSVMSSHITFWCLSFPFSGGPVPVSFPFPFLSHIISSSFYRFKLLVQFSSRAVVGLKAAQWH